VVSDTERALTFYRDRLQLQVAGESENYDLEQERLNNVFGARLRITAVRAPRGPGIEFLEYLAPSNGRPAPADLAANDVLHWQTTVRTAALDRLLRALRTRTFRLVSPGAIPFDDGPVAAAALVRDPDGHGVQLTQAR
jgi:catechol 2,3-dioxygenase-like lactoylglutathione lyase family enzyme